MHTSLPGDTLNVTLHCMHYIDLLHGLAMHYLWEISAGSWPEHNIT